MTEAPCIIFSFVVGLYHCGQNERTAGQDGGRVSGDTDTGYGHLFAFS